MKRTYNFEIADKIRESLIDHGDYVEEKEMFDGLCFMLHNKMLICVTDDDLLCRVGAVRAKPELENDTCRQMMMGGRASKDFVYVPIENVLKTTDLQYWLQLCLAFNPEARSSKKDR